MMRTTLTIDDDLMRQLRDLAHKKGLALKQLVNRVLRLGLEGMKQPRDRKPYRCPVFSMGMPAPGTADLDKALALAGAIEDEEAARKLELRK